MKGEECEIETISKRHLAVQTFGFGVTLVGSAVYWVWSDSSGQCKLLILEWH